MARKSVKRLTSTPGSKSKKLRKLLKLPFGKRKRLETSRILSATPRLTSIKTARSVKPGTPGTSRMRMKRKKSLLRTPQTPKLTTPNRAQGGPSAASPMVVLSRHPSRGFLDSPITIDDSLHEEKALIDLSDLPDHDPIPPAAQSSKKRPAKTAFTPKSQGHEGVPPPAKKLAFNKSMEEGELLPSPMTNGNQVRDAPPTTTSDIEIVAEVKAQPSRRPESSRWKTSRRYFNPRFQDRMKGKRRRAPIGSSSSGSLDRRQPHQTNRPPPLVPAQPPRLVLNPANFNFTETLNIVPGQVFEFKGNSRPLVPRMGARQISSSASCSSMGMNNVFVSPIENGVVAPKTGLRPIVIDGSNVAMAHGHFLRPWRDRNAVFSSRGIQICVDYFKRRGHHDITAIVPHFRLKSGMSEDRHLLEAMERQGHLMTTPSRDLSHGEHVASYDDRFIVQRAALNGGVIVSNDNYRDLMGEDRSMRHTIDKRLLMFRFIDQNTLMFPTDPLGSKGPNLDVFLNF